MLTITFILQGRLCNILYEYFATRVLQHYIQSNFGLEYKYVQKNRHILHRLEKERPKDILFVEEKDWYTTLTKSKEYFEPFSTIVLYGYFQTTEWLITYRDFIKTEVFKICNKDVISDEPGHIIFRIDELIEKLNNPSIIKPNENTLIIHLRLDDFYPSLIIDAKDYITVINKALNEYKNIDEVIFIVDKLRHSFEIKYLNELNNLCTNIDCGRELKIRCSTNNSLEQDFGSIMNAKYVISSNGTFSWIPIILGNSVKNWIPENLKISKVNKVTNESESWKYNIWNQK